MDEARRRAMEAEFDEKSAELSGMMEQVDEVQRAYARLALALRARAVKEKEKAKKQVLLRLSPTLWDEIAAWADEDFRSINSQIEFLLSEAVRQRRKK